ncbi:DUF5336 domain-containing protein [Williamsia sp. MIQD14]|uniref:DUF5336 domain-containing protein n=1 Tax=Williamsia sp. MIQD14 TaxID=3425703 RepID=UPI003DA08FAD
MTYQSGGGHDRPGSGSTPASGSEYGTPGSYGQQGQQWGQQGYPQGYGQQAGQQPTYGQPGQPGQQGYQGYGQQPGQGGQPGYGQPQQPGQGGAQQGYGQQPAYGQPGQQGYQGYGQQPGQQGVQQGYGQQPGQQGYGQQPWGQQAWGQGAQGGQQPWGQPAPAKKPSQGLPAAIGTYLVYILTALGLVNLFLGFANGISFGDTAGSSTLFQSIIGVPLLVLAGAGLIAGTTLLPNITGKVSHIVAPLSVVAALMALFQIVTLPEGVSAGIGSILLLVFGLIQAVVAVVLLLVDAKVLKTAPLAGSAGSDNDHTADTGRQATTADSAAQTAVTPSAYGYGQSTGQSTGSADAHTGGSASQTAATPAQGQSAQAQPSQAAQPTYGQSAGTTESGAGASATGGDAASGLPTAGTQPGASPYGERTTSFQSPDHPGSSDAR